MNHILRTPLHETYRSPDGERWCFACRTSRSFDYVVMAPDDPFSYYGPSPSIRCTTCGTVDGDCFPGTQREWDDD